jgi:tetraacyldisaccharide-1-P 4'-kinase
VIVITRAAGRQFNGVIARIREVNSRAPVYLSTVRPVAWHELRTKRSLPPEAFAGQSVVAFCGLGNPAAFWETLQDVGCIVSQRHVFADHHRYSASDLRRVAASESDVIVTTEKDAINLPEADVPNLYWLEIGVTVDRAAELFDSLVLPVPEPRP